jgi:hypothetical protein
MASMGTQSGRVGRGVIYDIMLPPSSTDMGYDFGELAESDGWSALTTDFSKDPIAAGDTLWFNSEIHNVEGLGNSPATVRVFNQTISFSVDDTLVTLKVPDSVVTFSPTVITTSDSDLDQVGAHTRYEPITSSWATSLPTEFKQDGFLGGMAYPVLNGLSGKIRDVTWQAQFSSDTPGVSLDWKWSAGAYSAFSSDYNALHVNALDSNVSKSARTDSAGMPSGFSDFAVDGGTGNAATTRYSLYSTHLLAPVRSSLSGFVMIRNVPGGATDFAGAESFEMMLDYTIGGHDVHFTTETNGFGYYSFQGLTPNIYSVRVGNHALPRRTIWTILANVGTSGGTLQTWTSIDQPTDQSITNITLNSGTNASGYDFFLTFVLAFTDQDGGE